MSAIDWAIYAVCVGFVAAAAWRLRLLWRDEAPGLRGMPEVWPWGSRLWRGYVRAIPSAVLTSVVGLISLPVLLAAPERTHGPFARPVVVVVPLLVLLALATAAMLATVLFNRPKRLVAPHLREQEGAAVEIWNRLKSRRRGRRR